MINLISGATGIKQEYDLIKDAYGEKMEKEKTDVATALTSLDDIIESKRQGMNQEIDDKLEDDDIVLEEPDE